MTVTLFLLGGFLLLQENLAGIVRGWGGQLQIFAYLEQGLPRTEIESLQEKVRSFTEVKEVRYVSTQEAWAIFKKDLGAQAGVLEGLDPSILPSSLEVSVKKAFQAQEKIKKVVHRLQAVPGIREVDSPEEWMEHYSWLVLAVEWAKWIVGGVLLLAALLIVGNTVKLAILARRDEIEIMHLVGATGGMIKAPFVLEGMIQGLLAAVVSLLLLWGGFIFLLERLPVGFGALIAKDQLHFLDKWHLGFLLVLGWAVGGVGSLLSLRRFLRT